MGQQYIPVVDFVEYVDCLNRRSFFVLEHGRIEKCLWFRMAIWHRAGASLDSNCDEYFMRDLD